MSWLSDAFTYFRRVTLLDHEVERLTGMFDLMKTVQEEHDTRLVRIETILEMGGYGRPVRPPRLPRG